MTSSSIARSTGRLVNWREQAAPKSYLLRGACTGKQLVDHPVWKKRLGLLAEPRSRRTRGTARDEVEVHAPRDQQRDVRAKARPRASEASRVNTRSSLSITAGCDP